MPLNSAKLPRLALLLFVSLFFQDVDLTDFDFGSLNIKISIVKGFQVPFLLLLI